ncbi:hypothetical protein OK351_15910 [Glutamicibacter sp. MNS18]|nr:hypothetical protein [Glutamicibacter sp. MNS18]MCW4466971.1 hypothetical protein [Glutamicibacter sp. MNS18]
MSRRTKRFLGNLSVLTMLVAIVVLLVMSAMSPSFLKSTNN